MSELTPNIPEVVAEVRERFERYERALVDKNVEVPVRISNVARKVGSGCSRTTTISILYPL